MLYPVELWDHCPYLRNPRAKRKGPRTGVAPFYDRYAKLYVTRPDNAGHTPS